jgi:hypothetical protein
LSVNKDDWGLQFAENYLVVCDHRHLAVLERVRFLVCVLLPQLRFASVERTGVRVDVRRPETNLDDSPDLVGVVVHDWLADVVAVE